MGFLPLPFAALALLMAACHPLGASAAGEADMKASLEPTLAVAGLSDCLITQPPDSDEFWFGNANLWTALPISGTWRQLALGEKFRWWSEEFDVHEDATPDLVVTASRWGRARIAGVRGDQRLS